jgi:hypothetical protein
MRERIFEKYGQSFTGTHSLFSATGEISVQCAKRLCVFYSVKAARYLLLYFNRANIIFLTTASFLSIE